MQVKRYERRKRDTKTGSGNEFQKGTPIQPSKFSSTKSDY